jgi:hypothetical protein
MKANDTIINLAQAIIAHPELPMGQAIAIEQAEVSFKAGMKAGIRLFAWWKDGTQYVGTCGTTLEKALKEIDNE